jgi:hypothetical protein
VIHESSVDSSQPLVSLHELVVYVERHPKRAGRRLKIEQCANATFAAGDRPHWFMCDVPLSCAAL